MEYIIRISYTVGNLRLIEVNAITFHIDDQL
jgi:hypothetical protein